MFREQKSSKIVCSPRPTICHRGKRASRKVQSVTLSERSESKGNAFALASLHFFPHHLRLSDRAARFI
jgi:hypothetical protein